MSTTTTSSIIDHHDSHNQSFSSTLLEQIYRSFDDDRDFCSDRSSDQRMKSTMKNSNAAVDRWIESEKITLRRKLTPPPVDLRRCKDRRQINHSSSTSSSDSSSGVGGLFSSSDTESAPAILKPIRTAQEFHRKIYSDELPGKKTKQSKEGNLQRRVLKLYSELKKVKQPISPGGKLTGFLNSLFHSKKGNISLSSSGVLKLETESPVTTSRSCLSKTPSSAGRLHRSVRFVDNNNNERDNERKYDVSKRDSSILANDKEFKLQIMEKQRRVEEVAKELLQNYHHHNRKELKVNYIIPETRKFDRYNAVNEIRNFEDEDEDEDDEVSCGSSDLFELENFPEIGMVDMYDEELPVYETTHVDTNRAIANGFIL